MALRGGELLECSLSTHLATLDMVTVHHQNWCAVHLLEKVPGFQGLSLSVSTYSGGWQEYCGMEVCFFLPTPLHPSHPSLYHALLLWKALNPDKV